LRAGFDASDLVAGVVPGRGGFVFYEFVTVEEHFDDNAEEPADLRQG